MKRTCTAQTAYGLPWDETCPLAADPTSPWGYCTGHTADARENYPHLDAISAHAEAMATLQSLAEVK